MEATAAQIKNRRATFRQLHESGCFILPNPWDIGSARYLASLGFKALASTSSGYAWSQGRPDYGAPLESVLAYLRQLVTATDLPVNADFEHGFADDADGVARNVRQAVDTGVAGLSIEDSTGNADAPVLELPVAVERIRAARGAIDESGQDVLLVGRAENFFVGTPDLDDTIRRLQAYAEAGADCLYAPGLKSRKQIAAVVKAVAPKPVNVLMGSPSELTRADLAELGVRRISIGGAMARTAWSGFQRAARMLAEDGRFDALADAADHHALNQFFSS